MNITVNVDENTLAVGGKFFACAIGKNGAVPCEHGREGDGKTPLGNYALRYGLYRKDRVKLPNCALEFHATQQNDGWCDAPADPAYNRPVKLPYPASAERLYKDSHVYDIVIVLGHNDSPPTANMGSAIFLHIAREKYAPTQGCVAISFEDMLELLPMLSHRNVLDITK